MCFEDEKVEEETSVELKIINEIKSLINEISHLKTELLMTRLENIDLENEIKQQKQKLNSVYGKKGK